MAVEAEIQSALVRLGAKGRLYAPKARRVTRGLGLVEPTRRSSRAARVRPAACMLRVMCPVPMSTAPSTWPGQRIRSVRARKEPME